MKFMNGLIFSPLVSLNKTLLKQGGTLRGGWLIGHNQCHRQILFVIWHRMSRNPPNWLLEEEQRFRRTFSVPGCNQIGRWMKLRISSPTFGSGEFRLGGGRSYHLGSCTHSWHGFWESGEWFGEVAGWLVGWLGFSGGGYLGESGGFVDLDHLP